MESKAFTKRAERFLNYEGLEFTEMDGQAVVLVHGDEYYVERLTARKWLVARNGVFVILVGSDELIDFFDAKI